MKIKAYLLFPETDNDFVRIGDNPQSYKNLIEEVALIKKQLKNHKDFELFYDSANINSFIEKAELLIDEKYLANCRTQLQTLIGSYCRNVNTSYLRKTDCYYFNWNINCLVDNSNNILKELSEAKLLQGQDKIVLINISNAYKTDRDFVYVIKDATHYNELPTLITIPITNNEFEFSEWHSSLLTPNFSLKDKTRFEVTAYKWNKQKIYREKNNGKYWYYDFFHNKNMNHYEVFSQAGVHLGEADMEGEIDTNKADSMKRIDHIIQ